MFTYVRMQNKSIMLERKIYTYIHHVVLFGQIVCLSDVSTYVCRQEVRRVRNFVRYIYWYINEWINELSELQQGRCVDTLRCCDRKITIALLETYCGQRMMGRKIMKLNTEYWVRDSGKIIFM